MRLPLAQTRSRAVDESCSIRRGESVMRTIVGSSASSLDLLEDRCPLPLVPGFGAIEADIEVPRELRAQWQSLGATVRECVAALLNGSTSSGASAFIVAVPLPEGFARDLACGG